jgi:hypothetical protein
LLLQKKSYKQEEPKKGMERREEINKTKSAEFCSGGEARNE